ncbi:MAG: response regulator [Planctomycetota bacterium]|nr:response regulator [Planctomycetota bacterium]
MANALLGRPMEILLVEDNRLDARLAFEALHDCQIKHRLTLIPDGREAMMFLRQESYFARAPRPDLILLDLNLPGHDGREILREIRQDYVLNDIPIVILTASRDEEDRLRSDLFQVEGYMTKPVNIAKFIGLVRSLMAYLDEEVILPNEVLL